MQDERDQVSPRINQQVIGLQSRLNAYNGQLDQLQLAASITQTGGAQIVSPAVTNESPVNQKPVQNLVLALLLGVVAGVILAGIRDHFDDRIKSRSDLEPLLGDLPVLATIPRVGGWRDRGRAELVSISHPTSLTSEAYRVLRTALTFLAGDGPLGIVHITSARPVEGKSTTVSNLAISFSKLGRRVVVVDCDLRRPRVHDFFDLPNKVGLSDILLGEVSVAEAVQRVPNHPRLAVVTAGRVSSNPSELLAFYRSSEVLDGLAAEADIVLLDGPPLLPVTDSLILAGLADATVLVTRSGLSKRSDFSRAVDALRQVEAPLVGAVLNDVTSDDDAGSGGYYAHAYGPRPSRGRRWRGRRSEGASDGARSAPTDAAEPADVAPPSR